MAAPRDPRPTSADDRWKRLRYLLVSAVFVPTNQLMLQGLLWFFPPRHDDWATQIRWNLVVATVMTPAFYVANRRWVWRREASEALHRDTVVFWVFAIVAVLASSACIAAAARLFPTDDATVRAVRVLAASLVGTVGVFMLRYVVSDRWLFAPDPPAADEGGPT